MLPNANLPDRFFSRAECPQDSDSALGSIGERVGNERVVARLPKPYLKDGPTSHRDMYGLYPGKRAPVGAILEYSFENPANDMEGR